MREKHYSFSQVFDIYGVRVLVAGVVLGALLPTHQALADTIGDGVDASDVSFNTEFPYLAYPSSGSDPSPRRTAGGWPG